MVILVLKCTSCCQEQNGDIWLNSRPSHNLSKNLTIMGNYFLSEIVLDTILFGLCVFQIHVVIPIYLHSALTETTWLKFMKFLWYGLDLPGWRSLNVQSKSCKGSTATQLLVKTKLSYIHLLMWILLSRTLGFVCRVWPARVLLVSTQTCHLM